MAQRFQTLIESRAQNGVIDAVNPKRLLEIPYFLLTNQPNNAVVIPAGQGSPAQVMTISGEGPAEIVAWGHQKTNDVRVFFFIQDGMGMRGLMNGAVHIDTIMGNGPQPYYMAEALYLDELRSLQVVFTDISGAGSTVRICGLARRYLSHVADPSLEKARLRMQRRQYLSVPYWYTLDEGPVTVGAGATVQSTITVGQDHHFEIFNASAVSTGDFNINIVDTARGESLISGPQDVNYPIGAELLFGNGNFPFRFHEPRLIQTGQRLLVTLVDRSGAPNTIHLTLGGRADTLQMWR